MESSGGKKGKWAWFTLILFAVLGGSVLNWYLGYPLFASGLPQTQQEWAFAIYDLKSSFLGVAWGIWLKAYVLD